MSLYTANQITLKYVTQILIRLQEELNKSAIITEWIFFCQKRIDRLYPKSTGYRQFKLQDCFDICDLS